MKSIWKLIDRLLIHVISLTGTRVCGPIDYVEVECLPQYLDSDAPQRRPARRLRFALP